MILVDSKETKAKRLFEYLSQHAEIEVLNLTVGDYIVGDILVERKSSVDFIKSIVDGRLWNQLRNLKEASENPLILIEGSLAFPIRKGITKIHQNVVIGAVASLIVDWKVPVVVLPSYTWTAELLVRMDKKFTEPDKKTFFRARAKPKALTPDDEIRRVVEGLPDVGPETAHRLLKRFKTLKRLFCATRAELASVPGIGEKRAARLESLFNREYESSK